MNVLTIVKLQIRLKGEKARFEFMQILIYRIFIKICFSLYEHKSYERAARK